MSTDLVIKMLVEDSDSEDELFFATAIVVAQKLSEDGRKSKARRCSIQGHQVNPQDLKFSASGASSYLKISAFHKGFCSVVKDFRYADSHEWVKVDGTSATVGITDHAQDHLGDVVYVKLPEVGTTVSQGSSFGAVESVKVTSDINAPISGKVVEVNSELSSSPGLVNASPYDSGWIIKLEMSDTGEVNSLMDSEKYSKFCEEEDEKH